MQPIDVAAEQQRAQFPGVVDIGGVVVADVPCRRCAYNLRQQNAASRCPECGAPVGVSIHGPLLRYSDPGWVRGLVRGAAFVFWGILLGIVLVFVVAVAQFLLGPRLAPLIGIAGGFVYLYGAWLLTEPDPAGIGEDQYGTARRIIRVATVLGILENVLDAVKPDLGHSRSLVFTLGTVSVVLTLAGVVGQFAMLRYLERLALRIPDPDLSARARFLFWAFGGSMAFVVVLGSATGAAGFLLAQAGRKAPPVAAGIFGGITCATGMGVILMIIFGIMFLVLLRRLRTAFDHQAFYARHVWANVEAGT